ncbi:tetratricopeptide repeat protein [Flavobacteriaceae bacterium]|nr:tetratricopeptide repeat protein [Flavobacteriaceae bacterium]
MKNKLFWIFVLGTLNFLKAQEGKIINHIYEGNSEVEEGAYVAAEKSYRKALSLAPEKSSALHNLGNTHFLAEQYDEASQRFFQTQKFASSKKDKQRAFHNMGNVFMKKKEYQKAVEAYKNALRNDPSDDETRYNYALAKELLENEKPPEDQEQDDKKDQKDQQDKEQEEEQEQDQDDQEGGQENKDEKDPNKEGDQGDENKEDGEPKNEGDQNKKEQDQQNKPPEKKKQAPSKGQLSPQQVQSLLEAMNNQEKKVQDKVNAKKVKGVPVRGKKDW